MNDSISRQAAIDALINHFKKSPTTAIRARGVVEELPPAEPEQQHGRVFKGIVVEYPAYTTYPECKGKPYFSINYTENGQEFIGYGTYKPEVLSEYIKEYFMPSAQPEIIRCGECVNHLGNRCLKADHHTNDIECCMSVFGAEMRTDAAD